MISCVPDDGGTHTTDDDRARHDVVLYIFGHDFVTLKTCSPRRPYDGDSVMIPRPV